ncbi:MAG TPA: hypothetical protein VJA46_08245 [Acidimicrobiia bacterium]|nr:hypothetical protein [Acidimicrobiia bacterium]
MKRLKIIGLVAVLVLIVSACSAESDTTTTGAEATTTTGADEPTTTASAGETTTSAGGENPLAEYNEDPTAADPALVLEALGDVEPSDEASWNIILASVARASQDLAAAGIDVETAMDCWANQECDTGTGGEVIMGYADGGGNEVNVWRSVSHMEAVLQALTYPEIGTIVSTAANFGGPTFDPTIAENDVLFLIDRGVDFIVGYPDIGIGLAEEVLAAEAAGIPYIPFSAGWVGLPDQDGALVPGQDYLTVVGENLCELGNSFAAVLNENVDGGEVGMLGGTTGNALTLGWQRCAVPALRDGGSQLVNEPLNEDTTTGDTSWVNAFALDQVLALLTDNPEIAGWTYEYSDGFYTALQAYDTLEIPVQNLSVALRTDEQTLFCDWVDRAEPTYNIWYSAGGNFQSRIGVTVAMMNIAGAEIPAEVVVPHVMRQVTEKDCNPDRVNPVVSGTSLVPDEVLALMFAG